MLVSVEHLTKYQNVKKIVEDVKFAIEDKDKIALIGKNGCGKSTLISMITRQQNSDQGTWFFKKDLKISCLSQDPVFSEQQSALYQVLSTSEDVKDYEAKAILTKLGISDYNQNISVMSGGQRKRVALAQALLKPCDLLILDEPTNHLDYEMINYLEAYLKKWNKALLLVTHDRYFLERICDKIIEMDRGKLYTYEANYSLYLQMKEEREQIALAQNQKRANILRKELAWMRAGVQARGTKSRDRINRFYALSAEENYQVEDQLSLNLVSSRLGKKVIEWEDITKSFGDEPLFSNFSYVLKRLDRIGILGENGCGKSTLLKCLAKEIEVDYGSVIHGETVKIGYFHQGHEEMDEAQRVIDYIRETSNAIETSEGTFSATQMLERFLFDSKSMY
ncbi:MAG: ABC-F family ATP-binding cassette domain-containing protein, partial [Longicatena sp.]|nr:ABC-F family ATP-binding cassette domain-containing protein [Longicatena sp.]